MEGGTSGFGLVTTNAVCAELTGTGPGDGSARPLRRIVDNLPGSPCPPKPRREPERMSAADKLKYSQPVGWREQPITPALPLALCPKCQAATLPSAFRLYATYCPRCQWNSWTDETPVIATPEATERVLDHLPATPGLVCLADIDYKLQGMFPAERFGRPVFVQGVLERTAVLVLDDGDRVQVPKAELFARLEDLREWQDGLREAATRGREAARANGRGYQKNRVGLSL